MHRLLQRRTQADVYENLASYRLVSLVGRGGEVGTDTSTAPPRLSFVSPMSFYATATVGKGAPSGALAALLFSATRASGRRLRTSIAANLG